jgi:hypothetical protein
MLFYNCLPAQQGCWPANSVVAASAIHYDHHVLFKYRLRMLAAGARALALVDQFKEQELSNVVWAFAKLHHYEQGLFAHLLAAVKAKLPHFLPQVRQLVNLIYSLTHGVQELLGRLVLVMLTAYLLDAANSYSLLLCSLLLC